MLVQYSNPCAVHFIFKTYVLSVLRPYHIFQQINHNKYGKLYFLVFFSAKGSKMTLKKNWAELTQGRNVLRIGDKMTKIGVKWLGPT